MRGARARARGLEAAAPLAETNPDSQTTRKQFFWWLPADGLHHLLEEPVKSSILKPVLRDALYLARCAAPFFSCSQDEAHGVVVG